MSDVALAIRPDEHDRRMSLPFVIVQANGVELEALLDSGAARTQFRNRPGLTVRARSVPGSTGASGMATSFMGTSRVCCRIGDVDVGTVDAGVVPADFPGHGDLIGQDILAQFRCTYGLVDGVLTLDSQAPTRTCSVHLDDSRHVYLDATWDGVDEVASGIFDTGASVTVADLSFVQRHPELFTPDGMSTGMDATGWWVTTPTAIMRGARVLDQQLTDALVAVVDLSGANSTVSRPMDLILGWTVLSQAVWYIDHPASRAACLPLR